MSKSLADCQKIFALNTAKLIGYIFEEGYSCTLGEAFRTRDQALLNAKRHVGVIDSQHCKRLAIDLNIFNKDGDYLTDSKDYKVFGDYWKNLDSKNHWGGDFRSGLVDGNHFEMQELT